MIKPIVQDLLLKGWGVDPDTYFGEYPIKVAIEIDPFRNPRWINDNTLFKVAVQVEPPSVNNKAVEQYLSEEGNKFDLILTYYPSVLRSKKKAKLFYFGDSWIKEKSESIVKSKMVSFVTSNKNFTPGHSIRMQVVESMHQGINRFDLYGRGFNPIDKKEEGLNDYKFSIVIENEFMKNWFTEKLVDCFRTKTIPIYKGCPNIKDFYNKKGIITFDTMEELSTILNNINQNGDSIYDSMKKELEDNYTRSWGDPAFNKRVEIEIKKYI
jgi:hypothetical protein